MVIYDGMNLASWRIERGITQIEAARRLGVSPAAWCRYESRSRMPAPAVMARIVSITDGAVTPADFYADDAQTGDAA